MRQRSEMSLPLLVFTTVIALVGCLDTSDNARPAELREARGVLRQAKDIAAGLGDTEGPHTVQERQHALIEVTALQAEAGGLEAAKQTANMLEEEFARSQALAFISRAQARAGDLEGALNTVSSMPNDPARDYALTYTRRNRPRPASSIRP